MRVSSAWQSGIAILEDNVFQKKLLPEDSSFPERRKAARVSVGVPLRFRIKGERFLWHEGKSVDVSNTGVRLAVMRFVPVGAQLQLDVWFPQTKRDLHLEGVVVWTQPSRTAESVFECGVAFKNLREVTKKERLIYFIADVLCGLATKKDSKDIVCYPAQTFEELKSAYRLIYEEYLQRGYCEPHPSQMHYSVFCVLPESRTFLLRKREGQILGTLSLIADSPLGLPMESVFPELVRELRASGRRLGEVSLLALDHQAFGSKSFSLTDFHKLTGAFRLFKLLFDYACSVAQLTDLVITVHPKHADLYRYLTYEIMAAPRSVSSACGKPGLPMRLDIQKSLANPHVSKSLRQYFVHHDATPRGLLTKYFQWDRQALQEMLVTTQPLWQDLPLNLRRHLKSYYPDFEAAE